MMQFFTRLLTHNWQQKLIAIIGACVIWLFVNQSILETKTLPNVPIRIINLAPNKTIEGLTTNGLLSRRATLTLTGTKKLIEALEPGDLEVELDAANAPHDWLIQISKKNLVSLNPAFDLANHITLATDQEFILTLRRLITTQIPIEINQPTGRLPKNYMYISMWPQQLQQTVTGPEEQVEKLKIEGLRMGINLDSIKADQLDELKQPEKGNFSSDIVSFKVPDSWKLVYVPFANHPWQQLNDPYASDLWIQLLRKQYIPLQDLLPIRIFYPPEYSQQVNPDSAPLLIREPVVLQQKLTYLKLPLFAYEVSQLFINTVKDNMAIVVVAQPRNQNAELKWSVEIIEPQILENRYVDLLNNQYRENSPDHRSANKNLEEQWRNRFRYFMQNIKLFRAPGKPLELHTRIEAGAIQIDAR